MPAWFSHVAQAEHNERTFVYLGEASPDHLDWQVTCLFYATLHYVDAYLHRFAQRPVQTHQPTHRERRMQVVLLFGRGLGRDYSRLQRLSEDARYDIAAFLPADVRMLYDNEFTRIRSHIRTALGL